MKDKTVYRSMVINAVAVSGFLLSPIAYATPVDLELVLAADVSGSVSSSDFNLQATGYENAFRNPNLISNIQAGEIGSIAATLVYWSDSAVQSVGWTEISDSTSSNTFADQIAGASRPSSGGTGMINALNYSANLFSGNGFESTRQVIDISGDGSENSSQCDFSDPICEPLQAERDSFLEQGNRNINALWIDDRDFFGDDPEDTIDALEYGSNNVIGGPNSFQSIVQDFPEFGDAIQNKLEREVAPPSTTVPEPGVLALISVGLLGFVSALRRKTTA